MHLCAVYKNLVSKFEIICNMHLTIVAYIFIVTTSAR